MMLHAEAQLIESSLAFILQLPSESRTEKQNQLVADFISSGRYFQKLSSSEALLELAKHLTLEIHHKDSVVFHQNDMGETFYIILKGRVGGYKEDSLDAEFLFTLNAGSAFGELALSLNAPRSCSIRALEYTELVVVRKEIYSQFESGNRNKVIHQIKVLLRHNPSFGMLEAGKLGHIARRAFLKDFGPNEIICREGERSHYVYVVQKGKVGLMRSLDKSSLSESDFGPPLRRLFDALPEKFKLECSTLQEFDASGLEEVLEDRPAEFSVLTRSRCTLLLINGRDLAASLDKEEVLSLKKSITETLSSSELVRFFLEHKVWQEYKKAVLVGEKGGVQPPPAPKFKFVFMNGLFVPRILPA